MSRASILAVVASIVLTASLVLPGSAHAEPIDDSARRDVVESLSRALSDVYVFADVGKQYADSLRARLAAGTYDSLTDDAAFADRLTSDLQALHPDKHLRVL